MKTASTFLQLVALSACLVARVLGAGDLQMPGVRRALQTMAGVGHQAITECLATQV